MVKNQLNNDLVIPDIYIFVTSDMETDFTRGIAFVGAICKFIIGQRTSINEYPSNIIDDIRAAEVKQFKV